MHNSLLKETEGECSLLYELCCDQMQSKPSEYVNELFNSKDCFLFLFFFCSVFHGHRGEDGEMGVRA